MGEEKLLQLPSSVATKVDVQRLARELRDLESALHQATLRGTEGNSSVAITQNLQELLDLNHLNGAESADREQLQAYLAQIQQAPVVHVSLAADPSPHFREELISWFRQQIHPDLLLQFGLQPTIAAGCILRTPNKVFDLSLRKRLLTHQQLLADKLAEVAAHE